MNEDHSLSTMPVNYVDWSGRVTRFRFQHWRGSCLNTKSYALCLECSINFATVWWMKRIWQHLCANCFWSSGLFLSLGLFFVQLFGGFSADTRT